MKKLMKFRYFIGILIKQKIGLEKKNEALNNDNIRKDLRTVQALQRKHEGLERDLAALGDKIHQLDKKAGKLMHT